jgi:hypothetical protein
MRRTNQKQIEAVLALPAPKRYSHFVKVVADEETIWGLYRDNGWALAGAADGGDIFPLWPAAECARLCATGDWSGYEPREIEIARLLDELLPRFEKDGVRPAIFPTLADKGVVPTVEVLRQDLKTELEKYE